MVAEAIDNDIPKGAITLYEKALSQTYPDIIHYEAAATEVLDVQVRRLAQRTGVLVQAIEKDRLFGAFSEATLSSAGDSGFANVYRVRGPGFVEVYERLVQYVFACVVDQVYAGSHEQLGWGKRLGWTREKLVDNALR
jgi:hypothetical protein